MLLLTDHTESVGQSMKTILTPSIMILGRLFPNVKDLKSSINHRHQVVRNSPLKNVLNILGIPILFVFRIHKFCRRSCLRVIQVLVRPTVENKEGCEMDRSLLCFLLNYKYLEHYNVGLALAPLALSIALVSSVSRMCGGDMPGSNTLGSLSTHASGWSSVSAGFAE